MATRHPPERSELSAFHRSARHPPGNDTILDCSMLSWLLDASLPLGGARHSLDQLVPFWLFIGLLSACHYSG